MSAQIISGRDISKAIRAELTEEVATLKENGLTPGLATVLVGEDPASQLYVGMKGKAAKEVGIYSRQITLPDTTSEDELLGLLAGLNADPEIDGILVQLPLPDHIDEAKVLVAIDPDKDVDGFHPVNVGRLATGDPNVLAPCTPSGVIQMLVRSGVDPSGKHAVVVGRSNIVGKPMAALLLRKAAGGNATVTVAHSRTADLGAITRQADVLVVAIGRPGTVTADMVKPGAAVIDVGTNRVDDDTRERGYRVVGDVEFDEVKEVGRLDHSGTRGRGPDDDRHVACHTVQSARARGQRGA